MFEPIDNMKMNASQVDVWIKQVRDENGGIILPGFAEDVLSKTNNFANIKKVLKTIKDTMKTREDLLPYRDFILACVDGREMSDVALSYLREMADLCGCRDELEKANNKPKFYEKTDCLNMKVAKCKYDVEHLFGKKVKVYFDMDLVTIEKVDTFEVKAFKFKDGSDVKLRSLVFMPEEVDVSGCDDIFIEFCVMPNNLKFKDGADVTFGGVGKLPKDFDTSNCSSVTLFMCDASDVSEFRVQDGGGFHMSTIENVPKNFNLSNCLKVELKNSDLSNVESLNFREGSDVILYNIENLPEDLDVSKCAKVNFTECDLGKYKELKFAEGANVEMSKIASLPEVLDISGCSEIKFKGCKFDNVRTLKLKNHSQGRAYSEVLKQLKGKNIIYSENDSMVKKISDWFGLGR